MVYSASLPRSSALRCLTREEKLRRLLLIGIVSLVHAGDAKSADAVLLRPGLYEVSVHLELPNIEGAAPARIATLCVSATAASPTRGLRALSSNNPLADCPGLRARQEG